MRKTIKELEASLESALWEKSKYYKQWQEVKDKLDELDREKIFNLNNSLASSKELISVLQEIIRWQINPETAKYPFMPDITQRDTNGRNFIN